MLFQSLNKLAQSLNKLAQSLNKLAQSLNKLAQSLNKLAQSLNKLAQSLNKLAQSLNKLAQSLNKLAQSLNKLAQSLNKLSENALRVLHWLHKFISNQNRRSRLLTYHGPSKKHFQRYFAEFCHRFNRRFCENRIFDKLGKACIAHAPVTAAELT